MRETSKAMVRNKNGGAERQESSALTALIAQEDDAEALLRSTLDALSAHVAVLDETGTIIAVNHAWRSFADAAGYAGNDHGLGTNYLAVCEAGAAESADAARTARALRDIIAGSRDSFRMEYPCMGPDGPRWFQLRVTRPSTANVRRIVIAHEDITDVKQAEESLARLSARIRQLQDEERRRIARELHDTTAQNLLVISLNAARLSEQIRNGGEQVSQTVTEIIGSAEQSLQEVRTLSYLLHPPLLDDIGLPAALRWLAKGFGERSGIKAEVRIDAVEISLPADVATALFRVAQEALANVHRHSGSPWVRVGLRRAADAIELRIEDRGRGLSASDVGKYGADVQTVGVGISGMRVRLEQLGGRLDIRPRQPGLLVRAVIPLGEEGARSAVARPGD
jgi:two-component system NarL family sensor kinase